MFLHLFSIFISFYFVLSVLLFCALFFLLHSLRDKEREKASSVDSLFHDFFLAVEYEPMYLISSSRSIRQLPRQNMFYIRIAKRSKCTKCSDSSRIEIMKTTSLILVCNWRALKRQIIYLILTSATVPLISFSISFSFSNVEKKKITEMEEYSEAISIHGFERKE